MAHHTPAADLPALPNNLEKQLDNYLLGLRKINQKRDSNRREDIDREIDFLRYTFHQYIFSREARIDAVSSPEIQEAIQKKTKLFPLGVPKLIICLDGRVLAKLFAGLHGNSLRLPAGDSKEIIPNEVDGRLFLPARSILAKMLFDTFKKTDTSVEVLDSHAGCAARGLEENERHNRPLADNGRYQDVIRKKAMGQAMIEAVAAKFGSSKRLVIIQTSFDPHTGFLTMGLEQCLNDPRAQKEGFTDEVVSQLAKQKKVISTSEFVENPAYQVIQAAFVEYQFSINYEIDYQNSTKKFWDAVVSMHDQIIPIIEERLQETFEGLRAKDQADILRERAVLLLANAFNAYLHNLYPTYPYHEHDESIIIGTFSDKGPYDRVRSFATNPDDPDFSRNAALAYSLIKGNRLAGRMSQVEAAFVSKLYPSREELALAPVPLVKFERYNQLPDDIETIQKADWSDLVDMNWSVMTDKEFGDYLISKIPNITRVSAEAINRLRRRARRLYKPRRATTNQLIEGRIAPLWVLAGLDRKALAIFPFLKSGYSESELEPGIVLDDEI